MLDRLKHMKESLMCCAEGQMCHLDTVDAHELGEVVDMIKDLEEAMYYCTITKAMHEKEEKDEEKGEHYYTPQPMTYNRDMDRMGGRMYYDMGMMDYAADNRGGRTQSSSSSSGQGQSQGQGQGQSGGNGRSNFEEIPMMYPNKNASYSEYMLGMRDPREGRSYATRRSYMESKEMHNDKSKHLKELEKYMQELTQDMVEMIEGASPEEKQYLEKRLSSLATKISQVNG